MSITAPAQPCLDGWVTDQNAKALDEAPSAALFSPGGGQRVRYDQVLLNQVKRVSGKVIEIRIKITVFCGNH